MSSPRPKTRAQAKARPGQRPEAELHGAAGSGASASAWPPSVPVCSACSGSSSRTPRPTSPSRTTSPMRRRRSSTTPTARPRWTASARSTASRCRCPRIPKAVQQAHLAAEDRDFYENSGISPTGIARAVWVGLRGGQTQGGSTITQQYVKNYFLTQDQTLSRKAKEILISIKIAKQQSKDQILENYLNTIYYGRGAYGVQTAAKAYFGKDVSKLTASEGALLASVIRGPQYYDPGLGAEQQKSAEGRVEYVLDGMQGQGWLTAEQRSKATFPKVVKYRPGRGASGPTGYLVAQVKDEPAQQGQAHRRRHRPGRLQGRHDDRQEVAGRRRQGRQGADARGRGRQGPARRAHQHQARRRRRRGDVRRRRLRQGSSTPPPRPRCRPARPSRSSP